MISKLIVKLSLWNYQEKNYPGEIGCYGRRHDILSLFARFWIRKKQTFSWKKIIRSFCFRIVNNATSKTIRQLVLIGLNNTGSYLDYSNIRMTWFGKRGLNNLLCMAYSMPQTVFELNKIVTSETGKNKICIFNFYGEGVEIVLFI